MQFPRVCTFAGAPHLRCPETEPAASSDSCKTSAAPASAAPEQPPCGGGSPAARPVPAVMPAPAAEHRRMPSPNTSCSPQSADDAEPSSSEASELTTLLGRETAPTSWRRRQQRAFDALLLVAQACAHSSTQETGVCRLCWLPVLHVPRVVYARLDTLLAQSGSSDVAVQMKCLICPQAHQRCRGLCSSPPTGLAGSGSRRGGLMGQSPPCPGRCTTVHGRSASVAAQPVPLALWGNAARPPQLPGHRSWQQAPSRSSCQPPPPLSPSSHSLPGGTARSAGAECWPSCCCSARLLQCTAMPVSQQCPKHSTTPAPYHLVLQWPAAGSHRHPGLCPGSDHVAPRCRQPGSGTCLPGAVLTRQACAAPPGCPLPSSLSRTAGALAVMELGAAKRTIARILLRAAV